MWNMHGGGNGEREEGERGREEGERESVPKIQARGLHHFNNGFGCILLTELWPKPCPGEDGNKTTKLKTNSSKLISQNTADPAITLQAGGQLTL